MIKKIIFTILFLILGISVYFIFIFDINNYKTELEDIISEKSNTEFRIDGDLELDLGSNTVIKAELLSVQKNNTLILESDIFTAEVSLSQILQGKFDINSVEILYSLQENSYTLINDEQNNVYLAKIKKFNNKIINENDDKFNEYANKLNSNTKNSILKSYDLFLNNKYDVTLNKKTLERVKNYFK